MARALGAAMNGSARLPPRGDDPARRRLAVLHTGLGRVGGSEIQLLRFLDHLPADGAAVDVFYHGAAFPELERHRNEFPASLRRGALGAMLRYLRVLERLRHYDRILVFNGVEPALLSVVTALHGERTTIYCAEPLRSLWEEEVAGVATAVSFSAMATTADDLYGPAMAGVLGRPRVAGWIRRRLRAADRRTVRRVARRVAITRFIAGLMERIYGLSAPPEVIYPFPPDGPPAPVFQRDASPLTVLCVGALQRHKDHATLLSAWSVIERGGRFPGASLIVIGDGPTRQELVRQAAALELRGVQFLGQVPTSVVQHWYSHANLLVHPALSEAFGITPVEAAQWGMASVVADSGGIVEFVEDGVTGRTFPTGRADRLAEILAELLGDPAMRERLARAAFQRTRTLLSRDQGIRRLLELASG